MRRDRVLADAVASCWALVGLGRRTGRSRCLAEYAALVMLRLLAALAVAPASAALLQPFGASVDAKTLMGTWYVQYQKPALAILESGGRNGIEKYVWDEANGGRFSVEYSFNRKGAGRDKITTVRQRGWPKEGGAEWEVAPVVGGFCAPVRLPFVILDVDAASHMICTGGLDAWMYVMTRERQPSEALLDSLRAKVEANGFDMGLVEVMEQDAS